MQLADYRYSRDFVEIPSSERWKFLVMGFGVIFASLGLGEAVYRITFFQFEGATDRLPIETMFGLAFAALVTKFLLKMHKRQVETRATLAQIKKRNEKIRAAVTAITPLPLPGHQQAIRVIREEVDSIHWNLADILPE